MTVLVVTGTGTDVGKTITTAALAACAVDAGRPVTVVKPAQTGTGDGTPGDLATVTRLTGVRDVHEFARYPEPLSPHHAARRSGLPELPLADTVRQILDLDAAHDVAHDVDREAAHDADHDGLTLVEGAGGLLVPFAEAPHAWTIADLAIALRAPVLVVTRPDLGTLNHTALTVDRLAEDGIALAGVVIGFWPADPDAAMRCSVADLAAMGPDGHLAGVLPAGADPGAGRSVREFRGLARAALSPRFGGTFDGAAFAARIAAEG